MGKGLIIIVLGISVIVGFFTLRLNSNSKENLSTTVNMFEQTQARLISNSGVEIYLEKLKADMSMNGKSFNNNSLMGGTYNISISGPDSNVTVTSSATFMGVTHTSVVTAKADRLPFFPVPGAMYISANSVSSVSISGNITVDGNDHDINGNAKVGNILPGIAVDNPADVTKIKNAVKGSADILGLGGTPSVQAITNGIDWEQYTLDVLSNPDILINGSTGIPGNLGTLATPKTTFVNGSIQFNSNLEGCGILVVNGDLTINGNFTYRGLIIAYKDSKITTKFNGNGKVYGAMIIAGTSADLSISNGNFKCLYSQEALTHISGMLKTKRFRILTWWE
jgi:hypothetical protein